MSLIQTITGTDIAPDSDTDSVPVTIDTDTIPSTTDSETAIVPVSKTTPPPIQPQKCEHIKEIININGDEYTKECKICTTQYKNGRLAFRGNSKSCSIKPNDPKPIITSKRSKRSRIPTEIKEDDGAVDIITPETSDVIEMSPDGSYNTKKYFKKYFYIRQNN